MNIKNQSPSEDLRRAHNILCHLMCQGLSTYLIITHSTITYFCIVFQVCQDINECLDGNNGGCVPNSVCINLPVSTITMQVIPQKNQSTVH